MNKYKHCYVFANNEKATRFYAATTAKGYAADMTGNAVFTNERVYVAVNRCFYIEPDEQPIWMSDHE